MLGFTPFFAAMFQYFFGILMFLTSVFLILLVLVQRGRGGGLAGAFGGMGGQSAFGTKAGDLFTRITMGAAAFWIVLCILSIAVLNQPTSVFGPAPTSGASVLDPLGNDAGGLPSTIPGADTGLPSATGAGLPSATGESVPGPAGVDPGLPSAADADGDQAPPKEE